MSLHQLLKLNKMCATKSISMIIRLCVIGLVASTLSGQGYNALSENSPFLPPGYNDKEEPPPPPVVNSGPLAREVEFRGIMKKDGEYQFSIFNKKEQKGYWLKENELQAGMTIGNYDPDSMAITLKSNGRSERISMASASENPLPVSMSSNNPNRQDADMPEMNSNTDDTNKRRIIPRRRVILPRK